MVRMRPIKRRTKWIIAVLALAIVGAVFLTTSLPKGGALRSLADDAELMMLMPQLIKTPIHIVDVTFDQSILGVYVSKLSKTGEELGLSARSRNTSSDPNDI